MNKEMEWIQAYEYWFASIRTLSHKEKKYLRSSVAQIEELYYIEESKLTRCMELTDEQEEKIRLSKESWDIKGEYEKMMAAKIHCLCYFEEGYPKKLAELEDGPYAIFYKESLPDEKLPTIAIVGARRCTPYGEAMASWFGEELGRAGVQVISGLAKGIDGIAQRAALSGGGVTYGVLGCGVDICYPRDHIGLYQDVLEEGGMISEQPLGTPPIPMHFPLRNRIISGMADGVIVIEAKERSGSLITADLAMDQGKEVYAVPGPLDSALSKGCNRLIQQGAGILLSPEDLMEELKINCGGKMNLLGPHKLGLESKENMVYSVLDFRAQGISQLIDRLKIPVSELMSLLVSLEIKGYVREVSRNYYAKIK